MTALSIKLASAGSNARKVRRAHKTEAAKQERARIHNTRHEWRIKRQRKNSSTIDYFKPFTKHHPAKRRKTK